MFKLSRSIGACAALLLVGLTAPAYSRQEKQDKPRDEERQQQQSKPAEKQQPADKTARQAQPQAGRPKDQHPQHQQQANGQPNSQPQQRQQHPQRSNVDRPQQSKPQQVQQHPQPKPESVTATQPETNRPHDKNSQSRTQQSAARQDQQPQQHSQQNIKSAQHSNPAQAREQQIAWQGDRAHDWQKDHRSWQQRGGYNGYRVTDDSFRAYYGQDHSFFIFSLPVVFVGGQRRFQYGGYWFALVDPWPEYWSNDWYDSDDMWVDDYAGGYYLCNRSHPGDRIAITFYVN
jgi:hypothetical protein